jgi:hypothetical protein
MLADKSLALNPLMPGAVHIFPEANFLIALCVPRDVYGSGFPRSPSLCPVRTAFLRSEGTATSLPRQWVSGGRSCPGGEIHSANCATRNWYMTSKPGQAKAWDSLEFHGISGSGASMNMPGASVCIHKLRGRE